MTDLFDSPVLVVDRPSSKPEFTIRGPEGEPLAHVAQVGGPQRSRVQRWLNTPNKGQVVVQAARPDRTPLFTVDRAPFTTEVLNQRPPAAVMAPDGTLVGRIEDDVRPGARLAFENELRARMTAHGIVDAAGRPICQAVNEPQWGLPSANEYTNYVRWTESRFCDYTDEAGVRVARMERNVLRIFYRLPDPLRFLIVASPVAMNLIDEATRY